MKNLESIPFHDYWAERFLVRDLQQAGLYICRIKDGVFLPTTDEKGKSSFIGEEVNIRANNYHEQDFERVFMYLDTRCPTWTEMVALKDMFFYPDEIAIQFHPEKFQYVNEKVTALHLWRPKTEEQLQKLHEASLIICSTTEKLRIFSKNKQIEIGEQEGKKFVAIYCGDTWKSWEEVCAIKKHYFGEDKTAFQLNISQEFDLDSSKLLTLWDATDFGITLPPREIV